MSCAIGQGQRAPTAGLGDDWIEVKTISPEKGGDIVHVKRAGNFNKLLVIKIDEDFEFKAKLIDRKLLGRSKGKLAKVKWSQHESFEEKDPEAILLPEGDARKSRSANDSVCPAPTTR